MNELKIALWLIDLNAAELKAVKRALRICWRVGMNRPDALAMIYGSHPKARMDLGDAPIMRSMR